MVVALHNDYPALYQQIHRWAKKNVPKPERCVRCNKLKKLELSNNSREYRLSITDWEWICKSCHAQKDQWNKRAGPYSKERMEKLWSAVRGKPSWNRGLKASAATRKKLSLSHMGQTPWNKGVPMSEESKRKLSLSLKGRIPWNKKVS